MEHKEDRETKDNVTWALIVKSKKGPTNKPIIFDTIVEGMEYFKNC